MVYVFKTSVKSKASIKKLAPELEKLSFVEKWNFDLHDCDNILRIEAPEFDTKIICGLLKSLGYSCVELL